MLNIEILHQEKIINKDKLTNDEHKAINALSDEEITQMVSINGDVVGPCYGFPL